MLDNILLYDDFRLIIISTLVSVAVLLISFSLHEFSHAFIAYKCGDPTAKVSGRLTINPFRHIDTIGFICCLFFRFGWAKPVPINPNNFRNYKKGLVLTSLAGITMNLILAFVSCGLYMLVIKFSYLITNAYIMFLLESFFFQMYIINLSLMVFNLLPIPPLDGFNAISAVAKYNNKFVQFMQSYGSIILILLLVFFDGLLMQLISWVSLPLNMFWNWIIF